MHGLIVFNKHNPLEFTEKDLQDYFAVAQKWFEKANKQNPDAKYPFLLWNCLWKSGASIMHGHMQTVLGQDMHYADAEHLNQIRHDYGQKYNSNYFEDLAGLHASLGLGFTYKKKVNIFTNIVPRKDKEITIIADEIDKDFVSAVHLAASTLTKEFGVESFNVAIIIPPMERKKGFFSKKIRNEWTGFPVIARLVDRGKLSNKTSDLAGMEIYAKSAVIETDPYKIIDKLKEKTSPSVKKIMI
jgi:galactose-1-phosphate uridylyltransferase